MLDAAWLAIAFAFLPELLAARAGVTLQPHPGWIGVLAVAAWYGPGGLLAGLIAAAGAAGIGSAVAGTGAAAWWGHLESGANQIAFGACLVVSSVASWHLRQHADLSEKLPRRIPVCRNANLPV